MEEYIQNEEELINLFLNDKESVLQWTRNGGTEKHFDAHHSLILSGIKYAINNDVQLTRQTFKEFLSVYKKLNPQELAIQIDIYNRCYMRSTKKDDMPMLLGKIKRAHIRRETTQYFNTYKKDKDSLGDLGANRQLIERLQSLETDTSEQQAKFIEIQNEKASFMEDLFQRRNNPGIRLTCNIPEIDETMNVGFKEGHLTLFCADVGSFKTTIMVNAALNLFKHNLNPNILYVPLEMPGKEILSKIVSRETRIPFTAIEHAETLSEGQIKMIAEEMDKWNNMQHRFSILEMAERSKVSTIRREIEKRISYFHPKVVFVDYADNLIPDYSRGSRSDLEMNDMLEDLRRMGKALGFSVVSAAQLARDSLKKVMEQKEGKHQLGSTDIRGGQVMTANSDTVYAQLRNPALPNEELFFFCIKARHGKNMFSNGRNKTILKIQPGIGLIESPNTLGWRDGETNSRILELTVPLTETSEDPY